MDVVKTDDVRSIREQAGLSQEHLSKLLKVSQSTVSRAERGEKTTEPKVLALVDLVQKMGPDGVRKAYLDKTNPAEVPILQPQKKGKIKRGKARVKALTPAIVLEFQAFLKKHDMEIDEAAESLKIPLTVLKLVHDNKGPFSKVVVGNLRSGMFQYRSIENSQFRPKPPPFDHSVPGNPNIRRDQVTGREIDINGPVDQLMLSTRAAQCLKNARIPSINELLYCKASALLGIRNFGFKCLEEVRAELADFGLTMGLVRPRPTKLDTPAEPVPPPPPTAATPAPKPAGPKLVVRDGKRLNNGDNVAPHLILDGKTMHVFTLIPGGVFLSYVAHQTE